MPTAHAPPSPRPDPGNPVRVLSVPKIGPVTVRFLAGVLGIDTHWKSGRTVPCPGPVECPSSLHKLGVIWKGYAAIEAWDEIARVWRPFVLEVTEQLEEILRGRKLRGEVWTLFRAAGKGNTDPVSGLLLETRDESKVSPAFDIKPVLCRMWHVSDIRLGTANPMPARIVLPPVQDDGPKLPLDLVEIAGELDQDKQRAEAMAEWRKLRGLKLPTDQKETKPHEKNGKEGSHHD